MRLTSKRKRQLEVEANASKASSGLRELLDEVDFLTKALASVEDQLKWSIKNEEQYKKALGEKKND